MNGGIERDALNAAMENWKRKIITHKYPMRVNPLDESMTDFVDVDIVMKYYLEDYRTLRKQIQGNICKTFCNLQSQLKDESISMKQVADLMRNIVPEKHSSPFVRYPGDITFIRSFIYSLVCGANNNTITKTQFLAACNRFGIDNPCPIITKRLSYYGNSEELAKEFKNLAEKNSNLGIDPDCYASADLKGPSYDPAVERNKTYHNFKETTALSPVKKLAGITNFLMI